MSRYTKKCSKNIDESIVINESKKVTSDKLTMREAKNYLEKGASFEMGKRRSVTAQMAMLNMSSVLDCSESGFLKNIEESTNITKTSKKKVDRPKNVEGAKRFDDSEYGSLKKFEKTINPEKISKKKFVKPNLKAEKEPEAAPNCFETASAEQAEDLLNFVVVSDIKNLHNKKTEDNLNQAENPFKVLNESKLLNETFVKPKLGVGEKKKEKKSEKKIFENDENFDIMINNNENVGNNVNIDKKRLIKGRKKK